MKKPGARRLKPGETHEKDARVAKPTLRPKMFLDDITTLEGIRKARMEILRASANCPTPDENIDPFSTYVPGTFNTSNGHLCLTVLGEMERAIQSAREDLLPRGNQASSKGAWNEAVDSAIAVVKQRRDALRKRRNVASPFRRAHQAEYIDVLDQLVRLKR